LEEVSEYKILVRGRSGSPKDYETCFDVTQSLRQRGYIAEFDLGHREPAAFRWILAVPDGEQASSFLLTDCSTGKDTSLPSLVEVFEVLGGAKCS